MTDKEMLAQALGEHPDTDIEFLIAKVIVIRKEARESAEAYNKGYLKGFTASNTYDYYD